MKRDHRKLGYPEIEFGGFSDVDGSVIFYSRVTALLTPDMIMVDFGCGRGASSEDAVVYRRNLRSFRGRVRRQRQAGSLLVLRATAPRFGAS